MAAAAIAAHAPRRIHGFLPGIAAQRWTRKPPLAPGIPLVLPWRRAVEDLRVHAMLYGRTREAAEIERLLGAAREGRGSAVLLRGEAGIGKSALLEHAQEGGTGFPVLGAGGVGGEPGLPFAALAALVPPALGTVDALPARRAAATRGARARGPPVESDRYAVAAAT